METYTEKLPRGNDLLNCWQHNWQVKEKLVLESPLQILQKGNGDFKGRMTPDKMVTQPCIVTYKCVKCGRERVERV